MDRDTAAAAAVAVAAAHVEGGAGREAGVKGFRHETAARFASFPCFSAF